MSHVLAKKLSDCNENENKYKRAYARHLKKRMINTNPEKYHEDNVKKGKEYYQKHKEELQKRARDRLVRIRAEFEQKLNNTVL